MTNFKIPILFCLATASAAMAAVPPQGDYVERMDTLYNSLTVERRGSVVELRARSRRGDYLESAVDLNDPLRLVVPYTRTLYAAVFFQPAPQRVLMVGLGGAGFHRLFRNIFPDALLQSVELDPKVIELAREHMGFAPDERTPVAVMDGRQFTKRNDAQWDWIILDAFRGGFVPPHLKTQEYYREIAARLSDRGVFVSNLHSGTELYPADIKTINSVFPQVVLFRTENRGNVIACAVKYTDRDVSDSANWADTGLLSTRVDGRLDLGAIRAGRIEFPPEVKRAKVLSDDFAPVEFLDAVKINNTRRDS